MADAATIYTDRTYLTANPTWHEEDSPWKAKQILKMIGRNGLRPHTIGEVGCGVGEVLARVHDQHPQATSVGYESAPEAYQMATKRRLEGLSFRQEDIFANNETFDLLLVIDVLEHVPDALGFAHRCREKATYKLYHIPLEINAQSVLRASFAFTVASGRNNVGHLHFYTAESALVALQETGHSIIDTAFTDGGVALAQLHPSLKRSIANVPRRLVGALSQKWSARLFGGYSMLVLCK